MKLDPVAREIYNDLIELVRNDELKKQLRKLQYQAIRSGYPRGRPRRGEIRPPSIGAIAQAKYRADNPEKARERTRIAVAKFTAENPERKKEQSKAYRIRKKECEKVKLGFAVETAIKRAKYCIGKG